MSKILLSIKPEYADKIFAGTKKYEYRKRIASSSVDTIVLYSTFPVRRILGEITVTRTICASPSAIWDQTKDGAGICREKFRKYFKGSKKAYAYCIGTVNIYDSPVSLEAFGLSRGPQSFVYLEY